MIEQLWKQIMAGTDVRQNLSGLRQELKKAPEGTKLLLKEPELADRLGQLLKDGDAKTRKNAALLMGDLGSQAFLQPVFEAYGAEQQMFVKSAYVTAMKNFDCRAYMDALKERLSELTETELTEENKKHVTEELRELSSLIVMTEGVCTHPFTGRGGPFRVVLLTNRNHQDITAEELLELEPEAETEIFNSGVRATVDSLRWVGKLRTYQELLFAVDGMENCPADAVKAAGVIAGSGLLSFLNRNHEGEPPYYFRVEVKSRMEPEKRSAFAKNLASALERLTERRLINTTSRYEFEIRLVESREGKFNLLIRLLTLKDGRFAYRKEVTPTCIRPYHAALTAALCRHVMEEDARVLDPFCGVGTMLIERHKVVRADTSYGIDIQGDAIEKARVNTEAAHQVIHYINKDFFDFEHEYPFDEIITDMPFQMGRTTEGDVRELYRRFFAAVPGVLTEDGTVILYSHDREHVRRLAPQNGFRILEEYEISMKEGTYVFILKRNGGKRA